MYFRVCGLVNMIRWTRYFVFFYSHCSYFCQFCDNTSLNQSEFSSFAMHTEPVRQNLWLHSLVWEYVSQYTYFESSKSGHQKYHNDTSQFHPSLSVVFHLYGKCAMFEKLWNYGYMLYRVFIAIRVWLYDDRKHVADPVDKYSSNTATFSPDRVFNQAAPEEYNRHKLNKCEMLTWSKINNYWQLQLFHFHSEILWFFKKGT